MGLQPSKARRDEPIIFDVVYHSQLCAYILQQKQLYQLVIEFASGQQVLARLVTCHISYGRMRQVNDIFASIYNEVLNLPQVSINTVVAGLAFTDCGDGKLHLTDRANEAYICCDRLYLLNLLISAIHNKVMNTEQRDDEGSDQDVNAPIKL